MHVRRLLLPTAIPVVLAGLALAVTGAGATAASATLTTNLTCYLVGKPVTFTGAGFAMTRPYDVSVDGIDLGTATTDPNGGFTASVKPGGLGANVVEKHETLKATDGTSTATARFTVTRTTGARLLAGTGKTVRTFRAPFQVWGFGLVPGTSGPYAIDPAGHQVYVHYLAPNRGVKMTIMIGRTGGQCGYLKSGPRRLFPFTPAAGVWTLQVDTSPRYSKHPSGPVARIPVRVA
jgi:hypothetical protein